MLMLLFVLFFAGLAALWILGSGPLRRHAVEDTIRPEPGRPGR